MGKGSRLLLKTALAASITTGAPLWPRSLSTTSIPAQSPSQSRTPDWQISAGGKMAFESASVKQNTYPPPYRSGSNFPLGPGDVYGRIEGTFRATNFPLSTYIMFAYKITPSQERLFFPQLPKWVITDRFDIEARAQGNPTKDQMRLMMQALLADRFRLTVHYESRALPVFVLVVDQPGKLGPLLQKHPDDSPCQATAPSSPPEAPPQALDDRFPDVCGGMIPMSPSTPGRSRGGARNVPMELIAGTLTGGVTGVDRPVLDRTGLTGKFDFALEFAPQYGAGVPPTSYFRPDPSAPTFVQAVKEQLGLKLEPQMASVDVLVIDYVEQLLQN